jgi:hypothetical protein
LIDAVRNDSHVLSDVLEDLAGLLSVNINTARIFLPTLITVTKLVEADVIPEGSVKIQAS